MQQAMVYLRTSARLLQIALFAVITMLAMQLVGALTVPAHSTLSSGFGWANAKDKEDEPPPEKTRKTQAISAKVYEKLAKAQEAAEAKDYNGAIKILDSLRRSQGDKLKGYDAASVWNVYGFIYYSQEKFKDAIGAYQQVVNQEDIPEALELGTKYTLAQLQFVVENYPAAVTAMNEWFKVANNPGPDPYVLLGQAYYQTKDYDNALKSVEKGMAVARDRDLKAKEHWYLLLRVLYYEKNDYKKTAAVLEELVKRWPKREYWVQLAGMYGELKREKDQLLSMEAAYVQGMLTREGELLNMAYLFLGNEMPYKAAKVVEKGIEAEQIKANSKNLELLGNSWRQAQHVKESITALEGAAKTSDSGELYSRLSAVYLDNEDFAKSVKAANKGFKKGGVKRKDNLWVIKGMAEFNLDRLKSAKSSFRNAGKDKRSKKLAAQWDSFLGKEQKRREQLAKDLEDLKRVKAKLAKFKEEKA